MAMWRSKLGNSFPRAEVEKLDAEHHRILKKLRSQPGNDQCVECGAKDNTWCSVNLGVFLCVQCADVHRALGTHISKVKGCGGTYLWGPDEIAQMQSLGNCAWGQGSQISSSMGKEEQLRICRKRYENKPLPQTTKGLTVVPKAVECASKRPSEKSIADGTDAQPCASKRLSEKSTSDDLDSFLGDCLKPAVMSNQVNSSAQTPTSLQPSSAPPNAQSCVQPIDLDWCFAPAPAPSGPSPNQGIVTPAPPCTGVIARSLSGFDFDSFFDECLQPSTSCDAGKADKLQSTATCDVGKVQKEPSPVSQQFDPFQICQQPAHPQPSLTGFAGMKFDSDAFFDDILGNAGGRQSAVSLKSSAMMW